MKKMLLVLMLLSTPAVAEPDWLDDIIDGDTTNGPYMPRPNPRSLNPPIFNNWAQGNRGVWAKESYTPIPPKEVVQGYYPWLPDGTRTPQANVFSFNWRF